MHNSPFTITLGDGTLFGICFIVILALLIFWRIFYGRIYKGRVRKVCIVKKRVTRHAERVFLSFRHTNGFCEYDCHTVDFYYEGRRFVHTKYVSEELFEKLREGKSYNVRVKGGHILQIMHFG